jgi:hypothetical protein
MYSLMQPAIAQSEVLSSDKNTSQSKRPLYGREILGVMQRALGGGTIIILTIVTILLWFLFRPAGQPTSRYLGEMLGTTAIVLFSCSLVVATKVPFLESFFGGLDRMYLWHRWSAIAGVVLLFPHYILVTSVTNTISNTLGNALGFIALFGLVLLLLWALVPRLPVVGRHIRTNYQRWFTLHRLTGLFVIAGLIHGFLVDPVLQHSTVLLVWYLAVAAIGTAAYLYRELLHPFFRRLWQHNYTVETVNQLDGKALEVTLAPVAQPVPFVAGQFIFVRSRGIPPSPLDQGTRGLYTTSDRHPATRYSSTCGHGLRDVRLPKRWPPASVDCWWHRDHAISELDTCVSHRAAKRVRYRPLLHGAYRRRGPISRRNQNGSRTLSNVPTSHHLLEA